MIRRRPEPRTLLSFLFDMIGALGAVAMLSPAIGPAPAFAGEVDIEDPHGSMSHFQEALAGLDAKKRKRPVRVLVYGTSTNGADWVTSQMRKMFAKRFGDGGKGYLPIARGSKWQRHADVVWELDGKWRGEQINRNRIKNGLYGFAGVATRNRGPATATFTTAKKGPAGRAVGHYRLLYRAFPSGGHVKLRVDDGAWEDISTDAPKPEDRVHELSVKDGPHKLQVRVGAAPVHLYGVTLDRDRPGVTVDAAMLVGTYVKQLLRWDPEHLKHQIEEREPDLIVFWMGANEAATKTMPWVPKDFIEDYEKVISMVRAGRPEASCLVYTTLDQGFRTNGHIETKPRVKEMVPLIRRIADEQNCAFFNLFEAIGGDGTMARWRAAKPKLVSKDFAHILPRGARKVGAIMYEALLRNYENRPATGG